MLHPHRRTQPFLCLLVLLLLIKILSCWGYCLTLIASLKYRNCTALTNGRAFRTLLMSAGRPAFSKLWTSALNTAVNCKKERFNSRQKSAQHPFLVSVSHCQSDELSDGPSVMALTKFTVAWKRQFWEKLALAAPGYLEIYNCTTCSYNVNKKRQDCRQIGVLLDLFSSIVAWQHSLKHTTVLLWQRGVTRRSPSL